MHANGVAHSLQPIDGVGARQLVDDLLARGQVVGGGGSHGASQLGSGYGRVLTQGMQGAPAGVGLHVTSGDGDECGGGGDSRCVPCVSEGLADALGGRTGVDDDALVDASRGGQASAQHLGAAMVVAAADEGEHLGCAHVDYCEGDVLCHIVSLSPSPRRVAETVAHVSQSCPYRGG